MDDIPPSVVRAAQSGDERALDRLVAAHLPLIYNIVGRALNAPGDTDDVVQDVMLQMVRDVRQLRDPAAFRSWLVAIAMRQVRRYWRERRAAPPDGGSAWLLESEELADPGADFADLTAAVLDLAEQRRETAEAARWLDPDDRELLAVWWMEVAGQLTRAELAAALGIPPAQAGVRVQRLKARVETARAVVRAVRAVPPCPELTHLLRTWDGRPAGVWRKRVARHLRQCGACAPELTEVVPAERLLADLALVPVPAALLGGLTVAALKSGTAGGAVTAAAAVTHSGPAAAKAMTFAKLAGAVGGTVAAVATVAVVTLGGPDDTTPARADAPRAMSAPATPAPTASAPSPEPKRTTKKAKAKPPAVPDTRLPLRAAFYYPWYDRNPHTDGGSHYTASAPDYDQDEPATVARQIEDMRYGGLQAGIASWWGAGKREDRRLPMLLDQGARHGFSWTAYYENEAYGNPSAARIRRDLLYLRRYTGHRAWLHLDGRPVLFVYADGGDGCGMVDRWTQANRGIGYYLVLKVFGGYADCARQPQGWHQYASGLDLQKGHSAVFSPGFFKYDADRPVVPRDLDRFRRDATTVATSGAPFQLLVTYNEWGEGTAAESGTDWASASGHGAYMDVLHDVFGAHPR
jgi:RNA polymerase sigma factor (sigma-70 family)